MTINTNDVAQLRGLQLIDRDGELITKQGGFINADKVTKAG